MLTVLRWNFGALAEVHVGFDVPVSAECIYAVVAMFPFVKVTGKR